MITKKHCFKYGTKVFTGILRFYESPKSRQLKITITARH